MVKRVPSKTDYKTQREVIKRWRDQVVSEYVQGEVRIFSAKDIQQKEKNGSFK